jgi:uncharacterized Zn-binding protein involved in type VI secretion
MALASGVPATGLLVIPFPISGLVQAGSSKTNASGLGVAHIGDPVMVPMPPTLVLTGSIAGTVTIPGPLQGTIENGSGSVRADGRGIARAGDSVLVCFPPTLQFAGTFAGQPLTGPIAILTPVRGIIKSPARWGIS